MTDVEEVHLWMVKHFNEHPLFTRVPDEELVRGEFFLEGCGGSTLCLQLAHNCICFLSAPQRSHFFFSRCVPVFFEGFNFSSENFRQYLNSPSSPIVVWPFKLRHCIQCTPAVERFRSPQPLPYLTWNQEVFSISHCSSTYFSADDWHVKVASD